MLHNLFVGRVWRIGRVNAFHPKGHGFDYHSSCHVGTLGKSLTYNCLCILRAMSGAPLRSGELEEAL